MANFMEYHVMGSVAQVRMKPGCVPTKFYCQPDRRKLTAITTKRPYILKKQIKIEKSEKDVEERRKLTTSTTERPYILKKQIKIEECEKDVEERRNLTTSTTERPYILKKQIKIEECEKDVEDRRNLTTSTTERPYILKKQIKIEEFEKDVEERFTEKQLEHADTSSESSDVKYEPNKVCRFCLRPDLKLHLLNNKHNQFIKNILKINDDENSSNLVPHEDYGACYMCMALLTNTYNFIKMVKNAHKVLHCILQSNKEGLLSELGDRKQLGVGFKELSTATFEVNIEPTEDTYTNVEINQAQQVVQIVDINNVENEHVVNQINNKKDSDDIQLLTAENLDTNTIIRKRKTYPERKSTKKPKLNIFAQDPPSEPSKVDTPDEVASEDDSTSAAIEVEIDAINEQIEINDQMGQDARSIVIVTTDSLNVDTGPAEHHTHYYLECDDITDTLPECDPLCTEENPGINKIIGKRKRNVYVRSTNRRDK